MENIMRKRCDERGFTLIELMVVIVILEIVVLSFAASGILKSGGH